MTAIRGTYSDLKFIRSRKVAQVVVEIPIEEAGQFTALFGTPNPATETWVAMARLNPEAAKQEALALPPERRKFSNLPPATQAGIRCSERAFWRFLNERKAYEIHSQDDAAEAVRELCEVKSRAELNTTEAGSHWHVLNAEYEVWMMPQ